MTIRDVADRPLCEQTPGERAAELRSTGAARSSASSRRGSRSLTATRSCLGLHVLRGRPEIMFAAQSAAPKTMPCFLSAWTDADALNGPPLNTRQFVEVVARDRRPPKRSRELPTCIRFV